MVLTKQSCSGEFIVVADLSIPSLEIRHIVQGDYDAGTTNCINVVARYVGRLNYNSISFVKRMFKRIELL